MELVEVLEILGMVKCGGEGKFLGLPYLVGHTKKQIFQFVKDREAKKVEGWKERLQSQVGKEVLIKSVLKVIPAYAMQHFLIPKGFCNERASIV